MSVATVIATGVNADGHQEVQGLDAFTTEDGAGWTAFLRGSSPGTQWRCPCDLRCA